MYPPRPLPDQELLDAWPRLDYVSLYDMEKNSIHDVGHISFRIRQKLVQSVRGLGLPDEISRIELAMGKLKFLDQASQRSWWDFVRHDVELVDISTRRGLGAGYMQPGSSAEYLEGWLEAGGGMHRAAQMMWDRSFVCGNQFHLPSILCPRFFNAEHTKHWRERALASWQGACTEAKRHVFDEIACAGTASSVQLSPEHVSRKKWIMRWFDDLLDGTPSTCEAIEEWMRGPIGRAEVDQEIAGALQAHLSMRALEQATVQALPARRGHRL